MIVCNIQTYSSFEPRPLSNEQLQHNARKSTLLPFSGDGDQKMYLLWWMPEEELLSPIGLVTERTLCQDPLQYMHFPLQDGSTATFQTLCFKCTWDNGQSQKEECFWIAFLFCSALCVRHEHILGFLHNYFSTTFVNSIYTSYIKLTKL